MEIYEKITEGLYRILGKRSNIYLLADESLILVDTGMPGDEEIILSAVQKIGWSPDKLKYIFITHAHLDHVGSLAALKAVTGARVVASQIERDHIEGRRMLCSMKREGAGGKVFRVILFILENFLQKYTPAQVDMPCRASAGPESIEGINIIATPGHSPGSLSYFHKGKKLLFTGDALSSAPYLRLPPRAGCSSYAQALGSVKALAEFDFEVCLFGHGRPLTENARTEVQALLHS